MALKKRIAVTLPAGPNIEDTVKRIKWAEDNGFSDAWFSIANATGTSSDLSKQWQHALHFLARLLHIGGNRLTCSGQDMSS